MMDFHSFLGEANRRSMTWNAMDEIHMVLGNEAGDLDSVMSTIAYAHFLHSTNTRDKRIAFLPVLNFDQEGMEIRLEHRYLFEEAKIDLDKLIYRSQLNFEEIIKEFKYTSKTLYTYLVDHHKLSGKDEVLKETVCRIFDHRPLDKYYTWSDHNLKMRIQGVASCCTLIADEMFKERRYNLDSTLAYLLHCTIVYDMKGFDRPGSLDEEIKNKLWSETVHRVNKKKIFNLLDELHCKSDHLTPIQILTRDLKFENGIVFPRLTMLAEDFIKLDNAYTDLEVLCRQYKSDLIVLICGMKKSNEEKVDVGVFLTNLEDAEFMKIFTSELNQARFVDVGSQYKNFIIFKFFGERMGRKKMLPLILDIVDNMKERTNIGCEP